MHLISAGRPPHRLVFLLGLVIAYTLQTGPVAGRLEDWCWDVCDISSSCGQVCYTACPDCPAFQTTCGAFNNGACENTCDQVCGPAVDGGTQCTDNGGGSTTCQGYGSYDACGDGTCNGINEDTQSCPADCGTGPTEENEQVIQDLVNDMDAVGAVDGTLAGASSGGQVFAAYGYSSNDVQDIDFENDADNQISCDLKEQRLNATDGMIKSLTRQLYFFSSCSVYAGSICGPAAVVVGAALNQAYTLRDQIRDTPCKPRVEG